ncbi:MAG: helix-turn-helix domain-containing protein [Pseudonocardia sp.]|nr:helix-turn-helix domain-containing protein [Pseudonocardia sp.]
MLTPGEKVEAQALRNRGWSISAIARHLGRDRKTARAYLAGERVPGRRASSRADPLARFVPYGSARFVDDSHLRASALFDEVVPHGYAGSYDLVDEVVDDETVAAGEGPTAAGTAATR